VFRGPAVVNGERPVAHDLDQAGNPFPLGRHRPQAIRAAVQVQEPPCRHLRGLNPLCRYPGHSHRLRARVPGKAGEATGGRLRGALVGNVARCPAGQLSAEQFARQACRYARQGLSPLRGPAQHIQRCRQDLLLLRLTADSCVVLIRLANVGAELVMIPARDAHKARILREEPPPR